MMNPDVKRRYEAAQLSEDDIQTLWDELASEATVLSRWCDLFDEDRDGIRRWFREHVSHHAVSKGWRRQWDDSGNVIPIPMVDIHEPSMSAGEELAREWGFVPAMFTDESGWDKLVDKAEGFAKANGYKGFRKTSKPLDRFVMDLLTAFGFDTDIEECREIVNQLHFWKTGGKP